MIPASSAPKNGIAREKATLRARMLAARDALSPEVRARAGHTIVQRILALDAFAAAHVVLAYASFGTELDTRAFITEVRMSGKRLVLPKVDRLGDRLALFAVRDPERELAANAWGIAEPVPALCTPIPAGDIEFVLVPGVAFDARGGRLGYGKAYYDRLIHACRAAGGAPATVAGAFEAQMIERVPMEAHDVAIDRIATEERFIVG